MIFHSDTMGGYTCRGGDPAAGATTSNREKEGVKIHFIKVKGHMDQHKGFLETFRCAKGNKLADEYATKGMQAETDAMPYKMEEVPPHIR